MLSLSLFRWGNTQIRRSAPSIIVSSCTIDIQTTKATTTRDYGSNRARRGLYDGKDIRSGNLIPFSMKKTRRKFRPNVFLKRLYSETLDAMLPFHVTTAALRSIDKAGGLDNYIMKNDFTEGEGLAHKQKIKKRLRNQAYFDRRKSQGMVAVDDPTAAALAAARSASTSLE